MWEKELLEAINAGLMAREKILEVYNKKFKIDIKEDNSPVTKADLLADKIIKDYLGKIFPEYSFLTEESVDNKVRLKNDLVWIIDPVDGTKDFINHDDEFTTNIALCYKHEIVVGVVIIPAKDEIYYASKGNGAFLRKNNIDFSIHVNNKTSDLTCLCSVFHMNKVEEELIQKHKNLIKHTKRVGSSIKACKIACGEAEITYRMSGQTKEWDTAAFQIIVEEAGGVVVEPSGKRITYNREDVYNRNGYIVANMKKNILL